LFYSLPLTRGTGESNECLSTVLATLLKIQALHLSVYKKSDENEEAGWQEAQAAAQWVFLKPPEFSHSIDGMLNEKCFN
jgi:hypothetical protein